MIDLDRTHLNYDLVQSELNFYQEAKGFEEKVATAKTEAIQRIGMIKEEVAISSMI